MSKQLPTDSITKELSQSVFFQKPVAEQHPNPPEMQLDSPPSPPQEERQAENESRRQDGMTDVTHDVMTSQPQEMNLKRWQEIIEDTETQNSALRMTSEERYAIEDVVSELRRKYGIKTSMNEIARLGLLVLIQDFKKNKKASIIHRVKKA